MTTAAPKGGRLGQRAERAQSQATADASPSVPAQLRRRRAASWRLPPLADGRRDPLDPVHPTDWTDSELECWIAAAVHLRSHGVYGRWQVPDTVRVAWYRRQACPCCRGAA